MLAVAVVFMVGLAPQLAGALEGGEVAVDIAGGIGVLALAPVLVPLGALLYAVMYVSGFLISFISFVAEKVIILGNDILIQPAVKTGWEIILNFANLGFVLAIIVIAFATIFRKESYAMKQALWKLIVAALLVNFSLVIAGSFISISKTTTDIFYNKITKNETRSMGDVLGTLAQPQEVTAPPDETALKKLGEKVKKILSLFTATGQLNFVVGLVFQLAMNFIIILTFSTLIIMLLTRVIALIFLLILSPIVWLLWIFPNTQKYWTQWWKEFIRWNFFAPAVMFFIYLAVMTRNNLLPPTKDVETLDTFLTVLWDSIMNNIVIMSLLIGGLYVANKFGIAGGSIGINIAKGTAQGAAKGMGRGIARLPLRGGATVLNKTGLGGAIGNALGAAGTNLQNRRGLRWLGKGLSGIAGGVNKATTYKAKKGQGVWASTWSGMKAGSGLFKGRGEKKEKTEQILSRLYTKKVALQGELDSLNQIPPSIITTQQTQRGVELSSDIDKVNKKIKELET